MGRWPALLFVVVGVIAIVGGVLWSQMTTLIYQNVLLERALGQATSQRLTPESAPDEVRPITHPAYQVEFNTTSQVAGDETTYTDLFDASYSLTNDEVCTRWSDVSGGEFGDTLTPEDLQSEAVRGFLSARLENVNAFITAMTQQTGEVGNPQAICDLHSHQYIPFTGVENELRVLRWDVDEERFVSFEPLSGMKEDSAFWFTGNGEAKGVFVGVGQQTETETDWRYYYLDPVTRTADLVEDCRAVSQDEAGVSVTCEREFVMDQT